MSSINPLTGEAAHCITVEGPDGVNIEGPSKFSPQTEIIDDRHEHHDLPRKKVDTFQTKIVPRKPFAPSDVKTNPQRLTGDATDLIVGNKKPDRFSVPRKSNMPDKPERTEKFGDIENLKNRRPGSLNDDIAASYAYPYVFGSPYTFGYQPRVIHAPIW